MAKFRINGTAGPDKIDLTGAESRLGTRYDGFEVFAGEGIDKVMGSARNDTLRGEAGDDELYGAKGNDTLMGGAGNDTLDGGDGSDTVSYQGEGGHVEVDLEAGTGKVFPGLTLGFIVPDVDTLSSIENATAGDGGSLLAGNGEANILTGGAGRDTLIGRGGNDRLIGGTNVDTASYAYAGQNFVDVDLLAGTAKVVSPANLVLEQDKLSEIENVIAGNGGSRMIGDTADNEFTGGDGRDDLRGGVGNDRLFGGANSDTLDGGYNDDILSGGAGNDTMIGGDGKDTASYADESFFVSVNLLDGTGKVVSPANLVVQQDTLSGIENVITGDGGSLVKGDGADNEFTGGDGGDHLVGGAGNDTLIGGANNDILEGGQHDDLLKGGLGNDALIGGDGVDTVSYEGQSGVLSATLTGGFQSYYSALGRLMSGDVILEQDDFSSIENLTTGDGGSAINGSSADNIITGGAGRDGFKGAGGNDTLIGGGDNDWLRGGSDDDTLEGGEGNDDLAGDGDNDVLTGGAGNDTLDGGNGIDTASYAGTTGWLHVNLFAEFGGLDLDPSGPGLEENDEVIGIENVIAGDGGSLVEGTSDANTMTGGAGMDTFYGHDGVDTLSGGAADDYLFGGDQDDVMDGGSESDFLDGGDGSDTLTGGSGADKFQYDISWDATLIDGVDTITDFDATSAEHDVIYLWEHSGTNTFLATATAAEALDQDYLVFVQYGTPGEGDFGTTVMIDRNGGVHLPQDMVALCTLEGVEASSLQAQHFFIA